MTFTFKEVCKFLNESYDFSKASAGFFKKAIKAAEVLGFELYRYGPNGLRVAAPDYRKTTYTKIPQPNDRNTRAIILTHVLLTQKLHQ